MKKTKLRLKGNVKIYLFNAINMLVGIITILTILFSKSLTVAEFKCCVLILLLTFIIEDLIPDIKKGL